jgi:Rad3-related DNA helicase
VKIVRIFGNQLFSFKYENSANEFERLLDFWSDIELLEDFFENNKHDLDRHFWRNITVEEAVLKTVQEAQHLEDKLRALSKQTLKSPDGLETLFRPLDDLQTQIVHLNKSKAKKSWLRIYALRIEKDVYAVTGGAIKLTHKMNEREHTLKELDKIEKCREYLIHEGIIDKEGITEAFEII